VHGIVKYKTKNPYIFKVNGRLVKIEFTDNGRKVEDASFNKKCILNHRGSRLVDKTPGEEECIADCDAMAHFYSIPSLLSMVYREKKLSVDEGSKFVMNKLDRSYNKMFDKEKILVKREYDSAKNNLK